MPGRAARADAGRDSDGLPRPACSTIDGASAGVDFGRTSTADAEAGRRSTSSYCTFDFQACGCTLEQGDHVLRDPPGTQSGIDVDSLTLARTRAA